MEFGYRPLELEIIRKVPSSMLFPLMGMAVTGAICTFKSDEDSVVKKITRVFGFQLLVISTFLLIGVLKTRDVRQIPVSEFFAVKKNYEFFKELSVFFKNLK